VNAAVAALTRPPVKTVKEAIWIRGAIAGRLKTVVAKKPESVNEIIESTNPNVISKTIPETKMLLTSEIRSSDPYWAVNLTIAELTPQSLKIIIKFGAVKTIPYKPYKSEPSNLAMNIVPIDEITVETTSPHSKWKLPLAEILAISTALLIIFLSQTLT
jgi:hypothetical protein